MKCFVIGMVGLFVMVVGNVVAGLSYGFQRDLPAWSTPLELGWLAMSLALVGAGFYFVMRGLRR